MRMLRNLDLRPLLQLTSAAETLPPLASPPSVSATAALPLPASPPALPPLPRQNHQREQEQMMWEEKQQRQPKVQK